MSLVNDHAVRARGGKALATLLGLNVVETDHCEGGGLEEALCANKPSFQARCGSRSDRNGSNVELRAKLAYPLVDKMGWTQHAEPLDLTAVEKLAQDQPGFDGFADANVVGDE